MYEQQKEPNDFIMKHIDTGKANNNRAERITIQSNPWLQREFFLGEPLLSWEFCYVADTDVGNVYVSCNWIFRK